MNSKDWRPTAFVDTAPGVVTEQEAGAARHAQRRELLGFLRSLLTLDAVALLLIATLIERAFSSAQRREAVTVAVGAFAISLAIGGLAHLALLAAAPRVGARHTPGDGRALLACATAFVAFAVGIAALSWFFLANWLR